MRRSTYGVLAGVLLCAMLVTQRAFAADAPEKLGPGTHELMIKSVGWEWHCTVRVPAGYTDSVPMPMVLVLHGAGGRGEAYLEKAGWGRKAEAAGFIVVAPDAQPTQPRIPANYMTNPRVWNSGELSPASPRSKIDDIQFFKDLLAEIGQRLNVDTNRTYVAGHSNGGGMTFRLGRELSDRFAAIAPVASLSWTHEPPPTRPLPTLYMVGVEDPLVPLEGGESNLPWLKRSTPPVLDTVTNWAQTLGCAMEPKTVKNKDGVKIVRYGPGKGGATLTVYYIEGQGHGWPGGEDVLPERMVGPTVYTVNATDAIWEFFSRYPPQPSDTNAPPTGAPKASVP